MPNWIGLFTVLHKIRAANGKISYLETRISIIRLVRFVSHLNIGKFDIMGSNNLFNLMSGILLLEIYINAD